MPIRRILWIAASALALADARASFASEGAAGPAFAPMDEIVVPIVDGPRAYGRLRVRLVVMARDAAAVQAIETQMPALRETAMIAAAEFARLHASPLTPVDAARLSRDISAAMAARDPHHVIARILLVSVLAARN